MKARTVPSEVSDDPWEEHDDTVESLEEAQAESDIDSIDLKDFKPKER